MASQPFTSTEWQNIFNILDSDPEEYGFPERRFGSVLIGSFNIRKLGSTTRGRPETWDFLARICRQFDLLAIQEVMDNLNGLNKLMGKLGDEFDMIVSDKTGVFPGESGVGERLTFIYRRSVVERNEVVSDVTYDRSKVLDKLHQNIGPINEAIAVYDEKLAEFNAGTRSRKPYIKMPVFLTFIRQPYIVSFRIKNYPGTTPYEFMGVNAHLHFGKTILDRKVEFEALLEWIIERVKESGKA